MNIIRKDNALAHRFFDGDFWDPFGDRTSFALSPLRPSFPKVDIAETESEVTITANVPGIDPKDIEIDVNEDSISLSGKISKEEEEKDAKVYRYEREYGEFRRAFSLPVRVDAEKVVAKSKNGVLTITLPKSGAEKKKKVEVNAE
ncbi:MAG: Hsp20/alpha crystallin family protein [Patescibacteria group bacterium]|nr:Hsp20/alpha crystallin family protein [Patescibacteria group bacterium]